MLLSNFFFMGLVHMGSIDGPLVDTDEDVGVGARSNGTLMIPK